MYIFGQPVLRKTAEEIDFNDYPNLKELIANMLETLEHSEGVGLAAPQVGLPIRLFIIDLDVISDDEPQYKDYRHAFINPEIIEESEETVTMSEGCLSIPGINESVKRPAKVLVNYLNENGEEQERWLEGFEARVFQHEYDHLDGILYTDIAKETMTAEEYAERLEALKEEHAEEQ
jgi:peptide deformylase